MSCESSVPALSLARVFHSYDKMLVFSRSCYAKILVGPDNADKLSGVDMQASGKSFTLLGSSFITIFSPCDGMLSGGFTLSRSCWDGALVGECFSG